MATTFKLSPEERHSIYRTEIDKCQRIIDSSGVKLIFRSLMQGNQFQRPSEMRSRAEGTIEVINTRMSTMHQADDLAELTRRAAAEAEADGVVINL